MRCSHTVQIQQTAVGMQTGNSESARCSVQCHMSGSQRDSHGSGQPECICSLCH